jgi:ribonuclease Z
VQAQICGPGEFQNLVNAIGSFVPNAATVYTRSFGGGEYIASAPIVLVDNELVKISATVVCPQPGTGVNLKDKISDNVSAVYICELPQILGKFDPQKAAAKGLKPGIKYGKLQKGEAVISDDSDEMVNMFTLSKIFFFSFVGSFAFIDYLYV